jgi:LAO/AO transport system kinase
VTRPALDRLRLARELTALANAGPGDDVPLRGPAKTNAYRIGLTGAPGAGKSSLAGLLAVHRMTGRRMGVLAVDPSSSRSGGAILGDRIRMDEVDGAGELYIRSLASRSTTDGLSDNLPEMLDAMDAHGFDEVVLETVGVGQAESAARTQVDTLVLVLQPESGDAVQAMKAGIMELADLLVVNKCDLPGAQKMATDLQRVGAVRPAAPGAWRPPVLLVSSRQPESIAPLSRSIDEHQRWLRTGDHRPALLEARARYRLRRMLERRLSAGVAALAPADLVLPLSEQADLVSRRMFRTPL